MYSLSFWMLALRPARRSASSFAAASRPAPLPSTRTSSPPSRSIRSCSAPTFARHSATAASYFSVARRRKRSMSASLRLLASTFARSCSVSTETRKSASSLNFFSASACCLALASSVSLTSSSAVCASLSACISASNLCISNWASLICSLSSVYLSISWLSVCWSSVFCCWRGSGRQLRSLKRASWYSPSRQRPSWLLSCPTARPSSHEDNDHDDSDRALIYIQIINPPSVIYSPHPHACLPHTNHIRAEMDGCGGQRPALGAGGWEQFYCQMGGCAGCVGPNRRASNYQVNRLTENSPIKSRVSVGELPSRAKDRILEELNDSKRRYETGNLIGTLLNAQPLDRSYLNSPGEKPYNRASKVDSPEPFPRESFLPSDERPSSFLKLKKVESTLMQRRPESAAFFDENAERRGSERPLFVSEFRGEYEKPTSKVLAEIRLNKNEGLALKKKGLPNIPELADDDARTPKYVHEKRKENGEDVRPTDLDSVPQQLPPAPRLALANYLRDLKDLP